MVKHGAPDHRSPLSCYSWTWMPVANPCTLLHSDPRHKLHPALYTLPPPFQTQAWRSYLICLTYQCVHIHKCSVRPSLMLLDDKVHTASIFAFVLAPFNSSWPSFTYMSHEKLPAFPSFPQWKIYVSQFPFISLTGAAFSPLGTFPTCPKLPHSPPPPLPWCSFNSLTAKNLIVFYSE